ncbi:endonuclease/exonuclease/phosphatase family protein, partial [Kineococcus sp. SYSU DK006]|uniref:endonuclease/exonuclease/phosphatase family protein n=1 Tax=Kineococcus sp. SYSU DK006 TaxID=3383127 RepID=UPI003D7CC01F
RVRRRSAWSWTPSTWSRTRRCGRCRPGASRTRAGTPGPRRGPARWCAAACTAYGVAATAALAAVLLAGDRTAPTYALALTAAWWLAPGPPLLLVLLLLRRPRVAVALLCPAVVAVSSWVPRSPAGTDAGDAPPLRVVTWNLTAGAPVDGLLALARESAPDLLVLQEVSAQALREVAPLEDGYPHRHVSPTAWAPRWGVPAGTAVLSRHPITDVRPVTGLPAAARPTDVVTVDVRGRPVAVVSVHLASPCLGCRFHPSDPGPAGGTTSAARVRSAEAERLAGLARELVRRGEAVVLAGDVNASDLNAPLRTFARAGLVDAYRAVAWGPGLTRGPWPGLARIDVVQVAGLVPLRARVGDAAGSDHAPVVVDLAPPAPGWAPRALRGHPPDPRSSPQPTGEFSAGSSGTRREAPRSTAELAGRSPAGRAPLD